MNMEKFVIEGGYPLSGELTPSGSKNEALPVLATSLLSDEVVHYKNVPRIRDVEVLCQIIGVYWGTAEWLGQNEVKVCLTQVNTGHLPTELCQRIRASILLAGPLLLRVGEVSFPLLEDVIGRRRLDTHFHTLEALSTRISVRDVYELSVPQLESAEIFLDEASVATTENALMVPTATGTTIIRNLGLEPHVC